MILDGLFDLFKKKKEEPVKKPEVKKTEKEIATEKGEPYVNILSMEIDPENMDQGAFELDWNEKFVFNLVRAGYQMSPNDTDADIVDRWFTQVCRNVVLETFEQYEAMSTRVVKSRDVGGGMSEVS
jgi:hypothetical protein